jgi:hypothetical protein
VLGIAHERGDRLGQRLVGAEHEVQLAIEHERQLVAEQAQGHVGGHAQGEARQQEAQVVAAPGAFGHARAPVGERTQARAYARVAGQHAHAAYQHHRTVEARVLVPARREIGDLDRAAAVVAQDRLEDGGVVGVVLFGRRQVFEFDRPIAAVELGFQQRAERRVAIEGRQAAPGHACLRIDQRAETAVADHAEVEVAGYQALLL